MAAPLGAGCYFRPFFKHRPAFLQAAGEEHAEHGTKPCLVGLDEAIEIILK